MAVGFPSGLHSQKYLDRAKNLSSALVKLGVQDANVQRQTCPALISAIANAANDSFVDTLILLHFNLSKNIKKAAVINITRQRML